LITTSVESCVPVVDSKNKIDKIEKIEEYFKYLIKTGYLSVPSEFART